MYEMSMAKQSRSVIGVHYDCIRDIISTLDCGSTKWIISQNCLTEYENVFFGICKLTW